MRLSNKSYCAFLVCALSVYTPAYTMSEPAPTMFFMGVGMTSTLCALGALNDYRGGNKVMSRTQNMTLMGVLSAVSVGAFGIAYACHRVNEQDKRWQLQREAAEKEALRRYEDSSSTMTGKDWWSVPVHYRKGELRLINMCGVGHRTDVHKVFQEIPDLDPDARGYRLNEAQGMPSPFFIACKRGHHDIARFFISSGVDGPLRRATLVSEGERDWTDRSNVLRRTTLGCAVEHKWPDIVNAILASPDVAQIIDKRSIGSKYATCAEYAVESGDESLLQSLITAKADIHTLNEQNETLLLQACRLGHRTCVDCLMEHGLSLVAISGDRARNSSLRYALSNRWNDLVPKILADPNISTIINVCSAHGYTPVVQAIEQKNAALLQSLIDAKANLDVKLESNHDHNKYVVQALRSGNNEVLARLLRARVSGVSAANLACMTVNSSEWRAQAQVFLDNGYGLHDCGVDWISSALDGQGAADHPMPVINFLVANQCSVTTRALLRACSSRSLEFVKDLMAKRNLVRNEYDEKVESDHYAAISEDFVSTTGDLCPVHVINLLFAGANIDCSMELALETRGPLLGKACEEEDRDASKPRPSSHFSYYGNASAAHAMRQLLMIMGADPTHVRAAFNKRARRDGLLPLLDLPIGALIEGTGSLGALLPELCRLARFAVRARADNPEEVPNSRRNRVVAWIWGHKAFIEQSPECILGDLLNRDCASIVLDYYRCADARRPDPYTDQLLAQCIANAQKLAEIEAMGVGHVSNDVAVLKKYQSWWPLPAKSDSSQASSSPSASSDLSAQAQPKT